jgi:hypothetical protein
MRVFPAAIQQKTRTGCNARAQDAEHQNGVPGANALTQIQHYDGRSIGSGGSNMAFTLTRRKSSKLLGQVEENAA